jgi:hypothetical protein
MLKGNDFALMTIHRFVNNCRRLLLGSFTVLCFWYSTSVYAAGWVAVGENGSIIYSADGINWATATSGTGETLRGVFFDGTGTWVAAGQSGTIVNSQDTVNWTQQASGTTDPLWAAAYKGGQWIVGGGDGEIVTSSDSIVWTSVNGPSGYTLFDVGYDGTGLFAFSGDAGFAASMLVSTDAVSWSQRTPSSPNNVEGLYGIGFAAGLWVAVGDKGTILTTTDPDSRSWTGQTSGTTFNLRDIIEDGSGTFVVVGEGGVILTSTDAITWTAQTSGTTEDLWGIEYDPTGLYVVVGTNGTILNSPDGVTWTPRSSPINQWLRDVAVGKLPQVITFDSQIPPSHPVTDAPFALNPTASASSGLPVSYASLTPTICSILGTTVTPIAVGTCTIEASQAGDATYLPATPVSQSIELVKVPQTITFPSQTAAFQEFVAAGTFDLDPVASASSGLPVSYSSLTPRICFIRSAGVSVVMLGRGTCIVQASQAGDAVYLAATPVSQSISIRNSNPPPIGGVPLAQTITFPAQPDQTFFPGETFALSPPAAATSGLLVGYNSLTPSVCSISSTGIDVTMNSVGVCTIRAIQPGDAVYASAEPVSQDINIVQLSQVITFDTQIPPSHPVTDAPFALNPVASASSGLPVSYASLTPTICSILGTTVTPIAVGTCTIEASQAGDATYLPATPVSQSIEILAVNSPPARPIPGLPLPALVMLILLAGWLGIRFRRG